MPKEVQRNGIIDPVYDGLAIRAREEGWTLELHASRDTHGRHSLTLLRVKRPDGRVLRGTRINNNDLHTATRNLWMTLPE